jgi:hypothetical protein
MRYSKGISWIDDVRIPFVDEKVPRLNVAYEHKTNNNFGGGNDGRYGTSTMSQQTTQGRFPANILVSDDMLNDGVISKSSKLNNGLPKISGNVYRNDGATETIKDRGFNDKGSNSRYYDIDKWFNNLIDG